LTDQQVATLRREEDEDIRVLGEWVEQVKDWMSQQAIV